MNIFLRVLPTTVNQARLNSYVKGSASFVRKRDKSGRRRCHVANVFTGIVQGTAKVRNMTEKEALTTFEVQFPESQTHLVSIGASVAINGACLTATTIQNDVLVFDAMSETLSVTNLSELDIGSHVNYERAARFGDSIGGHVLSGHIHTTATIQTIERSQENCKMTFRIDPKWMRYILSKGYVAVDGVSLTACEPNEEGFSVYLIPETLRVTTLGIRKVGDRVNIEVEAQTQAIVDTVERIMKQYMQGQAKSEM